MLTCIVTATGSLVLWFPTGFRNGRRPKGGREDMPAPCSALVRFWRPPHHFGLRGAGLPVLQHMPCILPVVSYTCHTCVISPIIKPSSNYPNLGESSIFLLSPEKRKHLPDCSGKQLLTSPAKSSGRLVCGEQVR